MTGRRLPLVLALGLVLVAVVAGAWVWGGERRVRGAAGPIPCPREVVVSFRTDADMFAGAERVAGIVDVESVATETQQQAYERFREIFKDRPDLLEIARPEALPASITVLPTVSADRDGLVAALRAQLPMADEVDALDCFWAPAPPT
ncbi:hypothetical protein SAMN05421810_103574 [Amycolatopsis arida]|uniref:FtsX extracellular domain-containing protein n=1 Tax=Amycolatopsis arida TaxID=587909 RepID=A0A1I5TLQ8_9PSEU|nr:permease-like cell division protein FtsX [Amycolatopsis arida]TDX96048.1 hypothetical protein CLV69_103183 [Amycolatopsis arida]SFP83989.1 hypothetical protein SAMN05421810_103574 [Amycolatopsis arida]